MQLNSVRAASFEVQAVYILRYDVARSTFGGKHKFERPQTPVRDVWLRPGELFKAHEASHPISLLLRIVLHELLVSDRPVVGVAHIRAFAAPGIRIL